MKTDKFEIVSDKQIVSTMTRERLESDVLKLAKERKRILKQCNEIYLDMFNGKYENAKNRIIDLIEKHD